MAMQLMFDDRPAVLAKEVHDTLLVQHARTFARGIGKPQTNSGRNIATRAWRTAFWRS